MESLIWVGTALSVLGLAGLVWCIVAVSRARRARLSDDDLRAAVQRVLPYNFAALGMSVIGLMMVILGISLG